MVFGLRESTEIGLTRGSRNHDFSYESKGARRLSATLSVGSVQLNDRVKLRFGPYERWYSGFRDAFARCSR